MERPSQRHNNDNRPNRKYDDNNPTAPCRSDFDACDDITKIPSALNLRLANISIHTQSILFCGRRDPDPLPDMELGHWVAGSMGHLGHLFSLGHRVPGSSL